MQLPSVPAERRLSAALPPCKSAVLPKLTALAAWWPCSAGRLSLRAAQRSLKPLAALLRRLVQSSCKWAALLMLTALAD
ncbi:MAG: hypothetical protein ACK52I_00260 [Pseudomonadota bacterium]